MWEQLLERAALTPLHSNIMNNFGGAEEHWLLLRRTWVWFTAPTQQLTATIKSSSREAETLPWTLQAPGTSMKHTHACRQALMYTKYETVQE